MVAPEPGGTLIYRSAALHVQLAPSGRLQISRAERGLICNVLAQRVMSVTVAADDDPERAWLVFGGALARVDFARKAGNTGSVGPIDASEAAAIRDAIDVALSLPRTPRRVELAALRARPEEFHEQLIQVEGAWRCERDVSDFAGAWLYPPPEYAAEPGETVVRVIGLWRCTGSRDFDGRRDGHGPTHLAGAEMDGVAIDLVR
jgi:hypothetical protein